MRIMSQHQVSFKDAIQLVTTGLLARNQDSWRVSDWGGNFQKFVAVIRFGCMWLWNVMKIYEVRHIIIININDMSWHTYIDKGCGYGRTIQWNHLQNLVRTLVCCRRLRQETMLVVDEETHEEKGIALKSGRHDSATCHRFKSCEMVWHCAVQHGSAKQLGSIKVLWIQKSKPLLTCLPGTRLWKFHVEIPWKLEKKSVKRGLFP